MIRSATRSVFFLLNFFLFASPCIAQQTLDGDWIGGWQVKGESISVKARFKSERGEVKGAFDVQSPYGATMSLTLTKVNLDGGRFYLEAAKDSGALVLDGRLKGDRIEGSWRQVEEHGAFEMLRVATVDPKLFDQYVGSYRLESGNFIAIGRQTRTGQNARLGYVELKSSRRSNLTPISESTFIGGPALGLDYPADVRITFVRNKQGEVEGLRWQHGKSALRFATSLRLKEEDVKFSSGENTIARTLVLPPSRGPHPAVILAHGSTPLVRHYFGPDPYLYPSLGIAVLFYDKRGVGASTGARSEVIKELAADMLAAVDYLKTRVDIDPRQIGLFGHSEGGWVVPEAASRSKDIAFIIAGAASGLSRQENILVEMDGDLRYAGFSESDRARARALWKLRNDVMRAGGEGWNKWREEITRARDEKWFSHARMPRSLIEMNETNRARVLNFVAEERRWWYDPVPAWEKITVPAIVYESEWDKDVPPKESAAIIERALKKAGNKDYAIKIFPKSQHGQWAMETDGPKNRLAYRVHYDLLFVWLLKHVTVSK